MVGEDDVLVSEVASGEGHLDDPTPAVGPGRVGVAVTAERRSQPCSRCSCLGRFGFEGFEVLRHPPRKRLEDHLFGGFADAAQRLKLAPRRDAGELIVS